MPRDAEVLALTARWLHYAAEDIAEAEAEAAAREKSIRHGHPSTLRPWCADATRAVILAL